MTAADDDLFRVANQSGPDAFLATLRAAAWTNFQPVRDLPGLRHGLGELERVYGITEAHRFATEMLHGAGAVLRHPEGHLNGLSASVLSPCGRYLAIGSWVGDGAEAGGALQIWEVAMGRCVNTFSGVLYGVGWPDTPRTIQWSADGTRIAVTYSTNVQGLWDPFGDDSAPVATAQVGDGASRPPAFALSPDGTRIYRRMRAPEPQEVHGGIMPLTEREFLYNYEHGTDFPDWPATELPAQAKALLGDDEVFLDWTFWSRDGKRVYGYSNEWIYSIDLGRGEVSWMVESGRSYERGARPAFSLDEQIFAVQRDGRLVFCDALTGEPVADVPGHPARARLVWGADGQVRRLAVLVPEGDGDGRAPVVTIYDDGVRRYDLDTAVGFAHTDDHDAIAWAWAPDGRQAAVVSTDGTVETWALNERAERSRTIEAAKDTHGVLWGADGVLILVGARTLRFVSTATGAVIGDFAFLREPTGKRLVDVNDDLGWEIRENLGYDPSFALDDDAWAAAFGNGVVVAPADCRTALDGLLGWAVDRRFAWPVRWGELTIVPDLAAAVEHVSDLEAFADQILKAHDDLADDPDGNSGRAGGDLLVGGWPPPDTAGADDLFKVVRAALIAVGDESTWIVDDSLRLAARLRAYRGEAAGAVELIEAIRSLPQHYRATAEVALILAGEHGLTDEARAVFTATDFELEAALGPHDLVYVGAAVAGACGVLGDTARADAWFQRVTAAIEPETNVGEHRLAVIWALLVCGWVDQARALWTDWPERPSSNDALSLLSFLVRTGRDDVTRELLTLRPDETSDGWFDDEWDLARLLVAHGRVDLLRLWTRTHRDEDDYENLVEELDENGIRPDRGLPYRPTEAETVELAEEYARLLRIPRSQRRNPSEELIERAAQCGHISGVLTLLPLLDPDDYNHRAAKAVHALWTVATGTDIEPW